MEADGLVAERGDAPVALDGIGDRPQALAQVGDAAGRGKAERLLGRVLSDLKFIELEQVLT